MHFICQQHQQQLAQCSNTELSSQWFEWMSQASVYHELGLHKEVLAYAGSALDLSVILMRKSKTDGLAVAAKKMVLACIYLTHCLKQEQQLEKANLYQSIYSELLQQYCFKQTSSSEAQDIEDCLDVLQDCRRHEDFFENHINLPLHINDSAANLARALH